MTAKGQEKNRRRVAVKVQLILSLHFISAFLKGVVWAVGADWSPEKARLLFLCERVSLPPLLMAWHFGSLCKARSFADVTHPPPLSDACCIVSHLSMGPLEPGSLLGQ